MGFVNRADGLVVGSLQRMSFQGMRVPAPSLSVPAMSRGVAAWSLKSHCVMLAQGVLSFTLLSASMGWSQLAKRNSEPSSAGHEASSVAVRMLQACHFAPPGISAMGALP